MITDTQLGVAMNILGILIMLLVSYYHFITAHSKE